MTIATHAHLQNQESHARDYWELLKPRVMALVVFTAIVGLLLAPGSVHLITAFSAILCIAVGSGAAGAINMWFDRDIDAVMSRTKQRPLPSGRVDPDAALGFGIVMALGSVLIMAVTVNIPSAFYLLGAILFYVLVYTIWLKRRTPQNIVIGGAAGAFPPVIGWVAVTGQASWEAWVLFAIIFFWTPPHFWALSLYKSDDYAKANVPMLPVVSGIQTTKNQIILYTLLLVGISLLPTYLGFLGWFYGASAALLGGIFIYMSLWIRFTSSHRASIQTFLYSIFYLFILFLSMVIDQRFFS